MRHGESSRPIDNEVRMRCVELVLRMVRKPPVQPRVDHHKYVEAEHRPEPRALSGVRGEPQEHGEERDVAEDERAAGRCVGHGAKDEEQPPLVLMNGVEFVRHQGCKGEVEEKISQTSILFVGPFNLSLVLSL